MPLSLLDALPSRAAQTAHNVLSGLSNDKASHSKAAIVKPRHLVDLLITANKLFNSACMPLVRSTSFFSHPGVVV